VPRLKTTRVRNGARYYVTDRFPHPKDKHRTIERDVFANDCIYACLDYLRRKCGYNGRMYRGEDGELLATKKVAAGSSTPETGIS
jgi:hypothetical protein